MAEEKRSLIWIPIVLALIGWILAYFSPLYHEKKRQPKITAGYREVDFRHFIATSFEVSNVGTAEERQVQCILPRYIFPGGGEPCTTNVRDISPHHIRYTMDNLSDKRVLTIYNMAPKETFYFTVYKGCFKSIDAYYKLRPSISYERLLDGVRVRTMQGDVPLVELKKERPKRRRSEKEPS